jgi:hypothetical protein
MTLGPLQVKIHLTFIAAHCDRLPQATRLRRAPRKGHRGHGSAPEIIPRGIVWRSSRACDSFIYVHMPFCDTLRWYVLQAPAQFTLALQ